MSGVGMSRWRRYRLTQDIINTEAASEAKRTHRAIQLLLACLEILVVHRRRRLVLPESILSGHSTLTKVRSLVRWLVRWLIVRLATERLLRYIMPGVALLVLLHGRNAVRMVLVVGSSAHEHRGSEAEWSSSWEWCASGDMISHHSALATFGEDDEQDKGEQDNTS
jgi:hypothetical protein